ncbi:MAG: heparan-alpha-glucosaminide N-acetyltransferase domain-containing protein [Steroidobacteraceae bacterium]
MSITADAATTQTMAASVAVARSRIASIDVMRGLVMLFMLVDHVREAIYLHMQVGDPMDVQSTDPALFFTRTLAHICAPTFVFLTGLGAWLYANPASGAPRSPSSFLIKRGLLLIFLELTVINFAWAGDMPPKTLWLQVIWAIGISMVALGLMTRLPRWVLATVGALIVFGHNLLTPIHFPPGHPLFAIWTILHERAFLVEEGLVKIKVTYPVLPWIGVILLGYVAGPLYSKFMAAERRIKLLVMLGAGCLALLVLLRTFNIYGETLPWAAQGEAIRTVMDFVNFTKYPPSLDFLLLTLGIALLLMAWFEKQDNTLTRAIAAIGGAPMFFYILHLYVLLVLQKIAVATLGANHGERWGVDSVLWIWIGAAVLSVLLYFPTRAFGDFKRRTSIGWVKYF